MTSALFFGWLKIFDSYTEKTVRRKASILINNCSAHGTNDNLPSLDNVKVIHLPPNTTSKWQPLDAGIIASMNLRYRRLQMECAIDLLAVNVEDI